MSTGKILLTGLLALAFAIGASSTANARSGYSFSISSGPAWGYPAWGGYSYYRPVSYGYVVGPAYYMPPPPPPVYWGYPRYYGPRSGFSFSYYGY